MTETEVLLVGAGPIGLEMAVALADARVDYVQLDARQVGHTISWFPRQARFFSSPERIAICGVPLLTVDQSKATREEYLAYLLAIVQQFRLPVRAYERAVHVKVLSDARGASGGMRFEVHTETAGGPKRYRSRHLILAIGDMHRPRALVHPTLPAVPGADLPHVHQYFDEPHPYVGQRLLIIGGRNSAVEAAIRCYRAGAHVAISYRRAQLDDSVKYWLKPEIQWLINNGQIDFYPNTLPLEIRPTSVLLASCRDGQWTDDPGDTAGVREIAADFVLPLIGFAMDTSLLEQAGVQLQGAERAPVYNEQTMETNVPGLFVIGTAAAGSQQRYRLFIETCHVHVVRVLQAIAGSTPQHINPLAFRPTTIQRDDVAES